MRVAWIVFVIACSSSPKTTTCPVCPVCPAAPTTTATTTAPPVEEVKQPEPAPPSDSISSKDLETSKKPAGKTETQAAIAHKLNQEGVELVKQQKYAEASAKFREAIARVPEPAYFLNACMTMYM